MSKSRTFVDILHNIDALSDAEQKALAGKLLAILSAPQNKENLLNGEDTSKFNDDAVVVCPYCGGTHIVKKDFSDDHVTRRYVCRSCGKSFRRTTNSVLSNTHKSAEVWEQFILLTLKEHRWKCVPAVVKLRLEQLLRGGTRFSLPWLKTRPPE